MTSSYSKRKSSIVKGAPSDHFSPSRILNVHTRLSSEDHHALAIDGMRVLPS